MTTLTLPASAAVHNMTSSRKPMATLTPLAVLAMSENNATLAPFIEQIALELKIILFAP